jgi:hypothetical protein
MRTDDFRTAPPPSVLHNVGTNVVSRDVSGTTPDTFQVFPMGEFDCEVTQTSHEILQRAPITGPASNDANRHSDKPVGAWLF